MRGFGEDAVEPSRLPHVRCPFISHLQEVLTSPMLQPCFSLDGEECCGAAAAIGGVFKLLPSFASPLTLHSS